MELAMREGSTSDTSLPDPEELPFAPDEIDLVFDIWTTWVATGKKYLPSQIMQEYKAGYGRMLDNVLHMDVYYEKTKAQLKKRKPDE